MVGTAGDFNLLIIVATIVGAGVISQVVAARLQIPSVVFLIATGIVLGPEGFEIINPDAFGGAISTIVGVSVAIIVFEGAFHLKVEKLRGAPSATLKLVTAGAAIALVGTAAVVHYALSATWAVSFVIGALLVATGPTVITPILQVVPVRDRVGAVLETEGIVNDVTAAIAAVVVFKTIVNAETAPLAIATLFVTRMGTGLLIGTVAAGFLYYVLEYVDLSPGSAPQNARLLVLATAVVSFGIADFLQSEAGVAAVATAGILLGNLDVPYERDIESFKGDLTLIVLSFVFITLAALLEFEDLIALGVGGLLVVVAVALVIRPLIVFLSMAGDRFTTGEKTFVALVGPRGIIPASVATLFALELRQLIEEGAIDPATSPLVSENSPELIVGTVFLVILTTVVFQAGSARRLAEILDIMPERIVIAGGGRVGLSLAERLEHRGENVVIIERNPDRVEFLRNDGFTAYEGNGTDTEILQSAGAENAKVVVAATGDDDANLLVAQLASSKFDVDNVVARVNSPDNVDAFEELGVRTVSASAATASALDNFIERPTMSEWTTGGSHDGDIQEVPLTADEYGGLTVEELSNRLPERILIALVHRGDDTVVPRGDFTIEMGDMLTLIGGEEAVEKAIRLVDPEEFGEYS